MNGIVLEVGPAIVASLSPRGAGEADPEMVTAALAGIDDTTVLFRERPVAVADLWQRVIAAIVEPHCPSMTVVYPSWWSPRRVRRVVDAAASVATDVRALSRSTVIADGGPVTVVEIADDVVAISKPTEAPVVLARTADPMQTAHVIENDSARAILVDAPPGVAGASDYARRLLAALNERGMTARRAGVRDVPTSAAAPPPLVTLRHWRGPVFVAASAVLTVCAIGLNAGRAGDPVLVADTVSIVEGRISVHIPAQWAVTRITAGPGSRRIQVNSPTEPAVALHVTQSYSPGEVLERTAQVLRLAVAEQPSGVFVDFDPAAHRGGRPAITYREVRVGRDIRWTVVLDGATRISVGCQSAPGREDTVAQACAKAIESAHELVGTDGRR
ncbi:type VII secretion-associated protein (TIGR03931 family) [Mycolicibacterium sp. BK634]|uniref:type VII secretion-associated protein n=1 Tax=Mycolicibacterium sp. BK634 TaxID=2587099 RepID=UPI001622D0BB|nr:type VII secretion-associated protein (TIGR03931 family) [Mycolicibacterium sp. BK634]